MDARARAVTWRELGTDRGGVGEQSRWREIVDASEKKGEEREQDEDRDRDRDVCAGTSTVRVWRARRDALIRSLG